MARPRRIFDLLVNYPPLISYLWTACVYLMIIGLVYMIFRRIRSLNYRRTLVLWKDGTNSIDDYKIKEGHLQIRKAGLGGDSSKDWTPKVNSDNVIPAKRSFRNMIKPIGFKQRDLFIAVEDSPSLVSIQDAIKEGLPRGFKPSILLKTWSTDEVAQFIKKGIAKAVVQRKVFSDTQFYMFFGIMLLVVFLQILIIRGMGMF